MKIGVRDRRFGPRNPGAWKILVEVDPRTVAPQTEIPPWLIDRWQAEKTSVIGYTSFRNFTVEEAITVLALAKGGVIRLNVNTWGHCTYYKLLP